MTDKIASRWLSATAFTGALAASAACACGDERRRTGEARAESRRQSDQLAVPEQHQSQLRPGEGDAEHPQHPAGDSDLDRQGLERHHAHDPAGDLDAGARSGYRPPNGIGDTVFTAFLSPANPGHWIWGAGPVVQIPTNSNSELGNKNWGLGPSFVVLHLEHGDPWVYGVLVNNIWSLTSNRTGRLVQQRPHPAVRQLQLQGRPLSDQRADPHRRLEGGERPAVDRADRRRRRQDLPLRQAAGEHADIRVLQRRQARFRCRTGRSARKCSDVPEVNRRVTAMSHAG